MLRSILALVLLLVAAPAVAAIVEVGPDDYTIWSGGAEIDVVQTATAPHPIADRLLLVWTLDVGTAPRDVLAGVIDANVPTGEALFQPVDDTERLVRDPAVAFDAQTQRFLVVWAQEDGASGGAYEIHGRYLKVDGTVVGVPFRISTTGLDDDDPRFDALQPAVASDDAGHFVVAWAADDDAQGAADGGFDCYFRRIDANLDVMEPVERQTFNASTPGSVALRPQLAHFLENDSWIMIWEGDTDGDASDYVPFIYGTYLVGAAPARLDAEPVLLSGPGNGAARRASTADRNPRLALDRQNQLVGVVWDQLSGGQSVARRITGVLIDPAFGVTFMPQVRDLDVEGLPSTAWVREPVITHSRIAGRFVIAWRESFDPGSGRIQTLMVRELDEASGFDAPAISVVNQGAPGPLPTEFGPPVLEGGWRANGRVFLGWAADATTKGHFDLYGQGLDAAAATAAPPVRLPATLALGVAPNPFNPRTSVEFALPTPGRVQVDVFDLRGRLVRQLVDEDFAAGVHRRNWSGEDGQGRAVASGVYLVRLRHPGGERVSKATLVE